MLLSSVLPFGIVQSRCAARSLHRRSGGAQGGGEKIWIRDPLLMGKNDSEVGWVAC